MAIGVGRRASRLAAVLIVATLLGASSAHADEYDADRAGHPLRILAYLVHPIGVAVDYLVLRPAHWLGSHEPLKTIVGHRD